MAASRILVLVALIVGDVTQADDVTPSDVDRFKRQLYGNYGGYPYSSGSYGQASPYSANPYSYNSGYSFPYTGGNYGEFSPNSGYGSNLGYSTGGGAYPYSSGYPGYPYNSGYYPGGVGAQYY